MVFQTEKQLKEFGEKIPAEKKGAIETAVADLKAAHAAQDLDKIEVVTATLNAAWQAASQDMYAQQGGAQGDPNAGGAEEPGAEDTAETADDVQDVEFEEVDETK